MFAKFKSSTHVKWQATPRDTGGEGTIAVPRCPACYLLPRTQRGNKCQSTPIVFYMMLYITQPRGVTCTFLFGLGPCAEGRHSEMSVIADRYGTSMYVSEGKGLADEGYEGLGRVCKYLFNANICLRLQAKKSVCKVLLLLSAEVIVLFFGL